MSEIKVTGFIIKSPGDQSVGIFPAYWNLMGDFSFDDADHLNEFRGKLRQSFECIADDAFVVTNEEAAEIIKKETA